MTSQLSLFDKCSSKCEAYASCGGHRPTAPCECIWPIGSSKRYKCDLCNIICRERHKHDVTRNFAVEIEQGYSLDQVNIQQPAFNFPAFIPTYTHKCSKVEKLENYVGVDIQMLFNCRKKGEASFKNKFSDISTMRSFLNVSNECKLVAVLNGPDWMLESFWAMNRVNVFKKLYSLGFSLCTGPTFSLTKFTDTNLLIPYSHHTTMLMRHHRVLTEIQDAGLCPIPNIYWIDNDKEEMIRWSTWLKENENISIITKDFTSTKQWLAIEPKVTELIRLLDKAGRTFHILINGTGGKNALRIHSILTAAGHKPSTITSAPILKAIIGGSKYYIDSNGLLADTPCPKTELAMPALVSRNMSIFADALISKAS